MLQKIVEAIGVRIDFLETKVAMARACLLQVTKIIEIVEALLHRSSHQQIPLPDLIVSKIAPELVIVLDFDHVYVILIAAISSHLVGSSIQFSLKFVFFASVSIAPR